MDNPNPELIQGFTKTKVRTFVGKNADYYLDRWRDTTPKIFGWNLSAFFFSIFWLGYRKMYSDLIIISLLLLFAVIFPGKMETKLLTFITSIVISSTLGGNRYYLIYMKKKIENIKSKNVSFKGSITFNDFKLD